MVVCKYPKGARCEGRHSSEVSRRRGAVRVRCDVEDPFDKTRAAPRNLLELSSVLHRPSEADRYRRPRGTVHEEVRRPDVREPQERGEGPEGKVGNGPHAWKVGTIGHATGSPVA